jgi:hypothetical protein
VHIIIEIKKISATIPTTIKEGQSLLSEMDEIATKEAHRAYQLEAQLAIPQQELYQACPPAQKSRIVLSRPATPPRQTFKPKEKPTTQPKRKRTQEAGGEPSVKRGQRKYRFRGEDVIGVADSEVGGRIEALMAEDEDGAEEKSEHERSPLDRINIVQTTRGKAAGSSAIAKGVGERNKGKGKAASSSVITRPCFFAGFLIVKVTNFVSYISSNMYPAKTRTLSCVVKLVVVTRSLSRKTKHQLVN